MRALATPPALRRLWLTLGCTILLCVPGMTHAMSGLLLDFRGQVPVDISVLDGWKAEPTPHGLHIVAPVDGRLLINNPTAFPIDGIFLQIAVRENQDAQLLWQHRDKPAGTYVRLPLVLEPNSEEIAHVSIDAKSYNQWDPHTSAIGLALPAGSEIYLQGIEFLSFSTWEKLQAIWQSFWKFDTFSGYSINFVWGPIFTSTPLGLENLFTELPPRGLPAVQLGYVVLLIAGALCFAINRRWSQWSRFAITRRLAPGTVLLVIVATSLWLIIDIRMGSELLSYAWYDYQTQIRPPADDREFRGFKDIHAIIGRALADVSGIETFGLVAPPASAVQPILRYRAYPQLFTEDTKSNVRDWLVLARPDVTVDEKGMLRQGDIVLLGPGKIISRYSSMSFYYRLLP
jgi:hypothetical protein